MFRVVETRAVIVHMVAIVCAMSIACSAAGQSIGQKPLARDFVVIDISGGREAANYPVSRLTALPPEGWTDEYKTDKIVLARISAGVFQRRTRILEYPYISTNANDTTTVRIKESYYIGIFPITQRQWELVTGMRPSSFRNDDAYAMRPVESVSYTMIRGDRDGTLYPFSRSVDADSFLGMLRAKTGLQGLDLPTENQWEYACHAGSTSQYGNGSDDPVSMLDLGRYRENSGMADKTCSAKEGTAEVGKYQPNKWGIYDMQGGVWEWCLDAADPDHVPRRRLPLSLDVNRILKGGHWDATSDMCAASVRAMRSGSIGWDVSGVRLVLNGAMRK